MDQQRIYRGAVLICASAVIFSVSGIELRARESNILQTQNVSRYPNTSEGLKLFLNDGVAAAKSEDKSKLDAFMKDTSILRAYDWFVETYGEENGVPRVDDYVSNIGENEKDVRETLARIGREGGEIATWSINNNPEPGNEIESEMLGGLKRPTRFYYAEWRKPGTGVAEKGELIGYFVFVTGKFRIARVNQWVVHLQGVRDPKTGVTEYPLPVPAKPWISGTKYSNPKGYFTLELPTGWKINEEIAKAPYTIGALSGPDGWANLVIQQIPASESPAEFLLAYDAKAPTMFENYKHVTASEMTLDGEAAASLRLTYTDREVKVLGISVPRTMETFIVVVRIQDKHVLFTFGTTGALFAEKENTFKGIVNSFRVVWK